MQKDHLNFTLVRPSEVRQRFTEFVMANQSLALEEQAMSLIQSEGFGYNDSVVMRQQSHRRNEKLGRFNPNDSEYSRKQSKTRSINQSGLNQSVDTKGGKGRKHARESRMQSQLS